MKTTRPKASIRALIVGLCGLTWCGSVSAATLFGVSVQGLYSTDEIYRYVIEPDGEPLLDDVIVGGSMGDPAFLAFDGATNLYAINRRPASGAEWVSQFSSPAGAWSAMAPFGSASFSWPHGAAVRQDELFVVNSAGGNVLRFLLGGDFGPVANGAFPAGVPGAQRLRCAVVAPWGELLVSECCGSDRILRFLMDEFGNANPNGTITGNLSNPHDMAFSPWGELFVANVGNNTVGRFVFSEAGTATTNGVLTQGSMSMPIGVTFSPWGELFVSSHNANRIWRWTFDDAHVATTNGFFTTPNTLGDIEFLPQARIPTPRGLRLIVR